MTRIVFDASAALAFALPDEQCHAQAVAIVKAFAVQNVAFCAPTLFAYECDSVIRLRLWKGTLTTAQSLLARAVIEALAVDIEYDANDRERALQIAATYDQPRAYDAVYAAHAESRGLELVTTDKPFWEAVNGPKKPQNAPPLTFVKLLA